MVNKKKSMKSQSNGKPGQSTSRMEIGHSSTSKQRKKDKKRKSLKLPNGESQNLKDSLQSIQGQQASNVPPSSSQVQQTSQFQLMSAKESRAQTLSPEKIQQSHYKIDSLGSANKNLLDNLKSPKQQQPQSVSKKNSMQTNIQEFGEMKSNILASTALDSSLKYPNSNNREHSSQLSMSSNVNQKGRPFTSDQNPTMKSTINNTSQGQTSANDKDNLQGLQSNQNTRSLIPLAINAARKLQQQTSSVAGGVGGMSSSTNSNFQISIQGSNTLMQAAEQRYKYSQQGYSPMKNTATVNNNPTSYQLATQQQMQINQELQQQLQSNISTLTAQQQMQLKTLQQQQFQHVLTSKQDVIQQQMQQYQQQRQQLANQVGINGLLNMTKQRGLNHQQIYNIRNQGINNRSHSSQKNQIQQQQQQNYYLQNNGKNIMAQKSPLYNSISGAQKIVQGQFIPPNYNQANLSYQQQQQLQQQQMLQGNQNQPCPLSIFDIQFYQSKILDLINSVILDDLMVQSSKMYQNKFNGGNPGIPINHSGFALVPQKPQQKYMGNGFIVSQPQYVLHKQRPYAYQAGAGNYYYYDTPVQVNGKQMGLPTQNAKQDRNAIKKGGSASILSQMTQPQYSNEHNSYLIHYDHQTLAHEELMKQAIFQELMENQQIPAQLLQQNPLQDKAFYSSIAALSQSEKLQSEQLISQPKSNPLSTVKKQSKIPFANAYVEDCYKFIVVPGNNSGLVKKALERRDWWIEIPQVHSMYNFKWQPVSYGIKFERLSPIKPKPGEIGGGNQKSSFQNVAENYAGGESMVMKQMVNHFEFHHFVSEKANLFNMMQKYCEISKENIFDLCPITFYVEVQDLDKAQQYNQIMQPFVQFYQTLEENKDRFRQMKDQLRDYLSKHTQLSQRDDEESDQQQSSDQPTTVATAKDRDFLSIINNTQVGVNGINQTQKITKFKTFNFEKRASIKYSFPMSHFDGYNLWLLKPTHLNRGRGIHVFRDLETFHKLIREYCQGKEEEVKVAKKDPTSSPGKDAKEGKLNNGTQDESVVIEENPVGTITDLEGNIMESQQLPASTKKKASPKKGSSAYKIKHNTFIIQKYIEQPLLLCNRKFDIRVWVLLDQEYDLYFFKEGYLRTSSSEFSIDLQNIDNQYVHLTNNAVQKFSEHYGQFEDGNQLSFKRFQHFIDLDYPNSGITVKEHLVPQMKELIIKSMYAVRKKIDPFRRKHCFELFGYDFILDSDFNVWLIEVNTNPCIEESSELLKILLPRMLEDMLKLTIDKIFPKIKKNKGNKKAASTGTAASNTVSSSPAKNTTKKMSQLDKIEEEITENYQSINDIREAVSAAEEEGDEQKQNTVQTKEEKKHQRIHPVDGYSNSESMWEKLWNLEKPENPPNKYSNFRSEFLININENKAFKLKRNPLYRKVSKEMFPGENNKIDDSNNREQQQ